MASPRRTWPQRLTLAFVVLGAIACFVAAGVLGSGQWVLSQRNLVTLAEPSSRPSPGSGGSGGEVIVPGATTTTSTAPAPNVTTTTTPLAEPDAANFLVTGADNGDCAGDDTPTVGDRDDIGERSDTIMVWRANPDTNQLAVLSLPRDLYVDIAGGRRARINSAYRRDDPSKLIDTIFLNFGVPIDHYIQVDFCAFRRLVDAVGGIQVPFEFPARDANSGLDIPEAGCVRLDGDAALSYVRSRKYQYEDPPGSGNWRTDGTSDFGRIARQQDFLRRTVSKVIGEGLYNPSVASALIDTNREYLVTDTGLTLRRMLEFANTLRSLDPSTITTYRVESVSVRISGQAVEEPRTGGSNMQSILSVFRGEATLDDAPEQIFESTATTEAGDDDDVFQAPSSTLPSVRAEENTVGISPDRNAVCP